MDADSSLRLLASVLLLLGNGFAVAAEYGIVSARKTRIESLAKKGNVKAKALLAVLNETPRYIAGIQVAITMFGIGIGSITEPMVSQWLKAMFGKGVNPGVSVAISFVVITFFFVVLGEIIPKYVTLHHAERVALSLAIPMRVFVAALSPLVWLVERAGERILRMLGISMGSMSSDTISKDELRLLVKGVSDDGGLEEEHAMVVSKALRIDDLDAADIMVHRLDIKWIDVDTPPQELLNKMAVIHHTRVPVCREDIDDVVGVLYVQDVLANTNKNLTELIRPVEAVPENLPLSKIINRMRESRSQIIIVRDEYGGTSGLVTLEDVVEEIFGELEDQLEGERPIIERITPLRLSARADMRYDELLDYLGIDSSEASKETLATLIVDEIEKVPRLGDSIKIPIGTARVENMARRRITRVAIQLSPEFAAAGS